MKKTLLTIVSLGLISSFMTVAVMAEDKSTSNPEMEAPPVPEKYRNFRKPGEVELRKKLTPLQYRVTQQEGTERPFNNEYWNNKDEGIYVDVVSGEPLFSSKDKFRSGTGWPSFVRPITGGVMSEHEDRGLFMTRVELRSKVADSHLGHVFKDGPKPTGLRYCINSASLRFIPRDELEKNGYAEFLSKFDEK